MRSWFKQQLRSTWVRHVGFWLVSLCVLTADFSMAWPITVADFIYTLLFHVSLVFAVYLHLRLLVHFLLLRRKYVLYVICLPVLICLAVLINVLTFQYLSDWIFPGYYFISYYSLWEIALFIGIYLLLTTLLKMSGSWVELQRTKYILEETKRRYVETELRALRDQVNPHFLFNSLHSIYSLALDGNPRTSDLVLRLADVLRFLLYENKGEKIPLSKELECIEAIIALQEERLTETAQVRFEKDIEMPDPVIAPLLLIPLVENALKHGMIGDKTDIQMALTAKNGRLNFEVRNRISQTPATDQPGGIGLENLRRRLALQYPGRHSFKVYPTPEVYLVQLSIDY